MIQRKQSLYLLIVFLIALLNYLLPILTVSHAGEQLEVCGNQFEIIEQVGLCLHPVPILLGTIMGISLLAVFVYKRRKLQIVLTVVNIFFHLLYAAYYYIYLFDYARLYGAQTEINSVTFLMPISLVLLFLVIKLIRKDQRLLNSLNRLR